MLVHKEGGGTQPPNPMIVITNAVQSDPSGLLFICIGFEVMAAHRFVFQDMIYGPKTFLRIDDK